MSNATNIAKLLPELLHRIFSLAADSYDLQLAPLDKCVANVGCNPWSKDLQVKTSLVQVCKSWRNVALQQLYHRICFHQVEQLCALVKVLEERAGYREWVHHIHDAVIVQRSQEEAYVENINKLLTLCSSCTSFSFFSWRVLDGTTEKVLNPLCSEIAVFRSIPTIQSTLHSLRQLHISLTFMPWNTPSNDQHVAHLPNLEELVCKASFRLSEHSLDAITNHFALPNLRRLTLMFLYLLPLGEPVEAQAKSILNLLERHGRNLSSLALDMMSVPRPLETSLEDIVLRLCPDLAEIRLPTSALAITNVVFKSPCTSLRKIDLYIDIFESWLIAHEKTQPDGYPCPIEVFLRMVTNKANFPHLQTLVLYDETRPDVPLGVTGDWVFRYDGEKSFRYFLSWAARFRDLGIELLRVDQAPVVSREQEKWNAWLRPEGYDDDERGAVPDGNDFHEPSYVNERSADAVDRKV